MTSPVSYSLEGRIGVIRIDNPPVNALSQAVRAGIEDAIATAQRDESGIVLLICEGRTFVAGADITEFGKPPMEPFLPDLLDTIEQSAKPVVAALHGTALGGGFELALASHYRCAVASAKVGLPEVKLGLLPGAGGTQRLPRITGVGPAIRMMTSGAPISASDALAAGIVDEIVDGELEAGAVAWCEELLAADVEPRRTSERSVDALPENELTAIRAQVAKRARGQMAPMEIVEAAAAAATASFDEGMKLEREAFMRLMGGEQSAALRHLFFAEREAAKISDIPRDTEKRGIQTVGIVGGGTMGGGIAMSFANAGFPVTLIEVNDEGLERGLGIIDKNYGITVSKGKLSEEAAAERRRRIVGSTDFADLAGVDLVIEAVFENLELKQDIFRRLDETCKPGAILATNTSYQDVDAIASVTERPADVIGLHFFSPANIMKLLEVVRGDQTAADVLATCMALAKKIGKVPVMSRVCYGFIGNRMLQYYGREAQLCVIEGGTPESVDSTMEAFGMAMGPLAVFDLAGMDVGYKAREILPDDQKGDPRAYRVADVLVEAGRLGQKTGAGMYRYDPDTRRRESDPEVLTIIEREAEALDIERRTIDEKEIRDRILFALINEGLNILDEGIAQRPGDIDVVYVYGYGFPAHRGGPMHYADVVGLPVILETIQTFKEKLSSDNWTPSPLLERLAEQGISLSEWARSR
ncbi:MAG: 3-hydroxyacyl-CoA dehydrogenase NAD-binding domain-containing protein [Woeseiaceae bacterium]|nr:3-hydroxyacyl-CoA dehydrogenase NAD-binding domain-containing protein [Woeseiaceae bacterium]